MSFQWDEKTRERIKKDRRRETRITWIVGILIILAVVGIRMLIIGGWNECFWAEDVGTCLSILRSRN